MFYWRNLNLDFENVYDFNLVSLIQYGWQIELSSRKNGHFNNPTAYAPLL